MRIHPAGRAFGRMEVATPRLRLVAFDAGLAALPPARLAGALGARVPPDAVDEEMWAESAERLQSRPGEAGWHFWLLVEHGAVVGTAGFKGPPGPEGEVEIGYGLVATARGRGLASEAARALVDWALRDARVRRIVAHTEAGNGASERVLAKLGFAPAGPEGPIRRFERLR